ncbi:MAG: SUF system NifU family Fe-S cluster assembly protein [Bacteroidota bacterium]
MNELQELYQQVILDHNKNPRNFGKLEPATHHAEGHNPLCGDNVTVELFLDAAGVIRDIRFSGSGCAISKASASIMTTVLKGKTKAEAEKMFAQFQHLVTADMSEIADLESLGKLAVFAGVKEFPARIKCASLSWHTMTAALHGEEIVSTE